MAEKTVGITLGTNAQQFEEFLTPAVRSAIRDKKIDLANNDTPVNFPKMHVETFDTLSGDNATVDTGATTARFDSDNFKCSDKPYNTLDGFGDSNVDTSIISFSGSTSGTGGTSLSETVEGSGQLQNTHFEDWGGSDDASSSRQETIQYPTGTKKLQFDIASERIEAFGQGTNTGGVDASLTINLRDLSDNSDQVIVSKSASSTGDGDTDIATIENGTWEIRQQPDGSADVFDPSGNVETSLANGIPSSPALFVQHTAQATSIDSTGDGQSYANLNLSLTEESDQVFQQSVVETTNVVSTSTDLTKFFVDFLDSQTGDSSVKVDFSADGGTTFELTDVSPRELVDLANLNNPGSDLRLRFRLIPNTSTTGTPSVEDYAVKGFDD